MTEKFGTGSWCRERWAEWLLELSPEEAEKEIGQMLLDAMDVVEQSPLEDKVIAAYKAFKGTT